MKIWVTTWVLWGMSFLPTLNEFLQTLILLIGVATALVGLFKKLFQDK